MMLIEYFLSKLSRLFLHQNNSLRSLKVVVRSLMLRHLDVVRCWRIKTIEIRDTYLVSFTYVGLDRKMLLKNVPLLVEVSIDPCGYMCCFFQLEILQLTISARRSVSFKFPYFFICLFWYACFCMTTITMHGLVL